MQQKAYMYVWFYTSALYPLQTLSNTPPFTNDQPATARVTENVYSEIAEPGIPTPPTANGENYPLASSSPFQDRKPQ